MATKNQTQTDPEVVVEEPVLTGVSVPVTPDLLAQTDDTVGYDQGGVYKRNPADEFVITSAPAPAAKSASKDTRIVFTNTRFPEQKIALTRDDGTGAKVRTGRYIKFNSTKAVVDDPAVADEIEAQGKPYIFREPDDFYAVPATSDRWYTHKDTGFRTLSKKAYEDWTNNSEWSAKPS